MSGTPGLNPRSGMISLDLPQGTVRPVPGGVDDHHVTVVYLGPDIDDAAFAKACLRARDAAAKMKGPLMGSVAGVSSFPPSGSSDGKRPAFAPVRLPGAKLLRSRLEDLSASEHKNWVPHVTLAYVGKNDPLPPAVPQTPVKITHLSVHRGGDVKRFPLGGGSEHSGSGPAVDLSAETARLAITPAPAGKPGGPGLWRVKGMELPPYFQNVRNALERSGHTPAEAYRLTWGAIRRWARAGGKVHPEVVAAAQAALADLAAKATAAHSHANESGGAMTLTWNGTEGIDLASVELGGFNPALHPHVAAGSSAGGQWGTTAGNPVAGKTPKGAKPPGGKSKASAQQRAAAMRQKAALHAQANADRAKAAGLQAQIRTLNAAITASAKRSAAAKKAAVNKKSATAKAKAAIKKASTTAKKKTTTAKKATVAQMRTRVASLQGQVRNLLAHAASLDRQAAAIRLAGDGDSPVLELAFREIFAERVPPGQREGGRFAVKPPQLTRYDTPSQAAATINAMERAQRASVRASILVPPGFEWAQGDRLAEATAVAPAR